MFNTVHAYCSGKGRPNSKDRSKYCPATRYQDLQRSSVLLKSLSNLIPGKTYDVAPGFSVLPKPSVSRYVGPTLGRSNDSCSNDSRSLEDSVDDNVLRQKDFEVRTEVFYWEPG